MIILCIDIYRLIILQLTFLGCLLPVLLITVNIFAFTGKMTEECNDQVLQLSILGCQTNHLRVNFHRHQSGYLRVSNVAPSFLSPGPFVTVRYRLGIEQNPNQEMWSCDISAMNDGLSVVSKTVN